jgi:plastocyanin
MADNIEIQSFLPDEITINEGDSIWFDIGQMPGFHTITFLAGQNPPGFFVPDPAATPVAGGPPPNQLINPALAFPAGGSSVDGSTFVSSGVVVFADPTKPIIYSFPKVGTIDYLCLPHQGVMKAKVIVQAKGSAYPMDQAAYDKKATDAAAQLLADAKAAIAKYAKASSTKQADGSTLWEATVGVGDGMGRGQLILPTALEIKDGDSVKWTHRAPGEPHTVTYVGSDTQPPEDTIVEPNPNGPPKIIQNNLTLMPQGGNEFNGKGYVNSGWLGIAQLGLPMDFTCKFTAPGDFIYYCALHGDAKGNGMAAKLKVSAA